jgi:hypothetical protein
VTDKDMTEALGHWRDGTFATFVATAICLASKTHPEEIRKALDLAYDRPAVERQSRRIASFLQAAVERIDGLRKQVRGLCAEVRSARAELEKVLYELEAARLTGRK